MRRNEKGRVQNYAGALDWRPATDSALVRSEDEMHSDEELDSRIEAIKQPIVKAKICGEAIAGSKRSLHSCLPLLRNTRCETIDPHYFIISIVRRPWVKI